MQDYIAGEKTAPSSPFAAVGDMSNSSSSGQTNQRASHRRTGGNTTTAVGQTHLPSTSFSFDAAVPSHRMDVFDNTTPSHGLQPTTAGHDGLLLLSAPPGGAGGRFLGAQNASSTCACSPVPSVMRSSSSAPTLSRASRSGLFLYRTDDVVSQQLSSRNSRQLQDAVIQIRRPSMEAEVVEGRDLGVGSVVGTDGSSGDCLSGSLSRPLLLAFPAEQPELPQTQPPAAGHLTTAQQTSPSAIYGNNNTSSFRHLGYNNNTTTTGCVEDTSSGGRDVLLPWNIIQNFDYRTSSFTGGCPPPPRWVERVVQKKYRKFTVYEISRGRSRQLEMQTPELLRSVHYHNKQDILEDTAVGALKLRDLRQVVSPLGIDRPSIEARRNCILVNLLSLRCIILHNRVLLILPGYGDFQPGVFIDSPHVNNNRTSSDNQSTAGAGSSGRVGFQQTGVDEQHELLVGATGRGTDNSSALLFDAIDEARNVPLVEKFQHLTELRSIAPFEFAALEAVLVEACCRLSSELLSVKKRAERLLYEMTEQPSSGKRLREATDLRRSLDVITDKVSGVHTAIRGSSCCTVMCCLQQQQHELCLLYRIAGNRRRHQATEHNEILVPP
eukprot:GHVS01027131.1.p1 GENE.GHVS01027131.1~~GHVS01027131.1.p1  ORF type:complete len:609 (+),score=130.98 GHVS01027131.1:235-2061(+)